jgi:hypothetical protein
MRPRRRNLPDVAPREHPVQEQQQHKQRGCRETLKLKVIVNSQLASCLVAFENVRAILDTVMLTALSKYKMSFAIKTASQDRCSCALENVSFHPHSGCDGRIP